MVRTSDKPFEPGRFVLNCNSHPALDRQPPVKTSLDIDWNISVGQDDHVLASALEIPLLEGAGIYEARLDLL